MPKYIISTLIVFITVYSNIFASGRELYTRNDLSPEASDPWKEQLTTCLPEKFCQKLYGENKTNFSNEEEFLCNLKITTHQEDYLTKKFGDFIFYSKIKIGRGEEGSIYLARHIPTENYIAVKRMPYREKYPTDALTALQSLNRLFGAFTEEISDNPKNIYNYLYLFMPLVIGKSMTCFGSMVEEEVEAKLGVTVNSNQVITYNNWAQTIRLMQAFMDEIEYCGKNSTVDIDESTHHWIVSKDKKYVIFVDLHSSPASTPVPDEKINTYFKLYQFLVFMALNAYTKLDNSYEIREGLVLPDPVASFLNEIKAARKRPNKSFYSLSDLKNIFEKLKLEMDDYTPEP